MSNDNLLERAKAAAEKLDLPWEYDEYACEIVTHTLQTGYGEYGGESYQYQEPAMDYSSIEQITAIIEGMNLLPALIAEVEANRDMLQKFQEHEDQTHAAMEEIFGNSDSFIELAREMKEEVERLQDREQHLKLDCGRLWQSKMVLDANNRDLKAEVERLRSENERLAKMFAENTYIESAHMEPGFYDINLRGQGAMLLIGHLIQMFRDTGGENFITNTLQMTLPDGKTNELFELTIQKVNGEDSPAMKITRLTSEIAAKDARIKELEAMIKQLGRLAFMHDVPIDQIIAHFVAWGQSNHDYTTRLEAAFLKSETERKFYTTINGMNSEFDWNGYPEAPQNGIHKEWFRQQAREALERIKEGGKDDY